LAHNAVALHIGHKSIRVPSTIDQPAIELSPVNKAWQMAKSYTQEKGMSKN